MPRALLPGESRLLVVEDHPQIRLYMRGSLESAGYEVAEATRGLGALELLKTCPCDLILSDYVLPDMTGVDLYHRIGAQDPRFLTRFILTTGALYCPEIETLQRTGPIRVLVKPFLSEEMIQVVGDVLDRDRLTPPLF
ncbi:MAG: response regulator [Nitrospirales bacterium]